MDGPEGIAEHHETARAVCPGCDAALEFVARYPTRFCGSCLERAADHAGVRLQFSNASVWGGLRWSRNDEACDSDLAVLCRIGDIEVVVREARFGGVVAEPLATVRPAVRPDGHGVRDLR